MGLVLFRKNSVHCNLLCGNEVQWNLVSTDTKGTCHTGVLIIQAPVVQTLDSAFPRINHYPADKY